MMLSADRAERLDVELSTTWAGAASTLDDRGGHATIRRFLGNSLPPRLTPKPFKCLRQFRARFAILITYGKAYLREGCCAA